jgi:DNA-binding HxlR family transcriptional regulator
MAKKALDQSCPVAKTLDIVGERWTLLIIRDLLLGAMRFQDVQQSLSGIAPNVLSDRLKTLETHGLVRREFYSDHPPRAAYVLTDIGRELGLVVLALGRWGTRHLGGKMSRVVVHQQCGHPVEVRHFCPHCKTSLVPSNTATIERTGRRR